MARSRLRRRDRRDSRSPRRGSERCRLHRSGIERLTPREREVLALIAAGASNEGICTRSFVSPKTVESHVHSIFLKLALPRGADVHARVLATRAWLQAYPESRAA